MPKVKFLGVLIRGIVGVIGLGLNFVKALIERAMFSHMAFEHGHSEFAKDAEIMKETANGFAQQFNEGTQQLVLLADSIEKETGEEEFLFGELKDTIGDEPIN
jgi:hypothetical protein